MRAIRLNISDEAYEEVMDFLKKFDENQVKITSDEMYEAEYAQPDSENRVNEPAVKYDYPTDEDFNETEEYNPAPDDPIFLANKRYLARELERIESGKAVFYTLEEVEQKLEATIAKYETDF